MKEDAFGIDLGGTTAKIGQTFGIRHKQIISYQIYIFAKVRGHLDPSFPIFFV